MEEIRVHDRAFSSGDAFVYLLLWTGALYGLVHSVIAREPLYIWACGGSVVILAVALYQRPPGRAGRPILTVNDRGVEFFQPSRGLVTWDELLGIEHLVPRGAIAFHRRGGRKIIVQLRATNVRVRIFEFAEQLRSELSARTSMREERDPQRRDIGVSGIEIPRRSGTYLVLAANFAALAGFAIWRVATEDTRLSVKLLSLGMLAGFALMTLPWNTVRMTPEAIELRGLRRKVVIRWSQAILSLERGVTVSADGESITVPVGTYRNPDSVVQFIRDRIAHAQTALASERSVSR